MIELNLKPKKRSKFRKTAGLCYYRAKRQYDWHFSAKKFAKNINLNRILFYNIFEHQTPLLRELNQVEMQLQYNKITNLKIASTCLNGLILLPGETFSYWKLIGKPTYKKGYVDGLVLSYGTCNAGVGGGLCQLSNLLYWMTLHTPLSVIERHRHSYDVFADSNRTQPFGSGATCAYNALDLQIQNNTQQSYQLLIDVGDIYLRGRWQCDAPAKYRYEIYEQDHFISSTFWGGYIRHNKICRSVYYNEPDSRDKKVADEFVSENHALMMYEPLLQSEIIED